MYIWIYVTIVIQYFQDATSQGTYGGNRKPGRCPVVPADAIGPCVDLPICNVDSDCYGVQKCCPNGCGHECLFPVDPKPGTCPVLPPGSGGTCAEHCSVDSDCRDVQKCCSNGCGHDCFFPVTVKPGTCPTLPPDTAGTCVDLCSVDSDCLGDQKCCSHGCGHSCSSPVSSCPPEPKCPIPPRDPPRTCKPPCKFEYKVINGLRCRVKCFLGPKGPRRPPCPPTGCPGEGQPEPAAQQGSSGALLGAPTPTCAPVCEIPCPFGFVLDENNCPICECKTGCYGNAEPLFPSVNCAEGPSCPSSYHCATTPEGTFGECCPIECPQLLCLIPCPHGFKVDENDCQTCECLPACPKAICPGLCEYGFKYDSAGCQTCDCRSRSCPQRLCPWACPKGYKFGKDSCQTCDCRRGIPCPPEPSCPPPNSLHPFCPGPCIYQNRILDGITCIINCFRGLPPPPGRPGDPCPPTGCPGKPTGTAVQRDFPRYPPGTPPGKRRCPVDSGSNAKCYGHYHRYCKDDSPCPKRTKCCKQGCSYKCVDAV